MNDQPAGDCEAQTQKRLSRVSIADSDNMVQTCVGVAKLILIVSFLDEHDVKLDGHRHCVWLDCYSYYNTAKMNTYYHTHLTH